jgi:hypothetical protein
MFGKFFNRVLTAALAIRFGMPVNPWSRKELIADPKLQRLAMTAGNRKRHVRHRQTCLDAYQHKIGLAIRRKGNNTTSGIPQEYLPEELKGARA